MGQKINVDWEAEIPTIPDGQYECEVNQVEVKEGQKAPYLGFRFKITNGPFSGQMIFDNVSTSPRAAFRMVPLLKALGFSKEDGDKVDTDDFAGRSIIVVGRVEPSDDGVSRFRVKEYQMHPDLAKATGNSETSEEKGKSIQV